MTAGRTLVVVAVWLGLLGAGSEFAAASVSINDAAVIETNSGSVLMTFTVTQEDTNGGITIDYATADQTAEAPADYQATQGTVSLSGSAGDTDTITVAVNGDTLDEPDERFRVVLLSPPPGSDAEGLGTIIDDDSPADSDGDGVADSSDACPTVPGPPPSGCPATEDSDGDGVPNATDACPMVAGDMPDGCPSLGLPPPVLGRTANLEPVSGEVFVRLPAGSAGSQPARAAQKGQGFIPLQEARQVPIGSFVDTKRGTVKLSTAVDVEGTIQSGKFASGLFQILQRRRDLAFTELRLKGSTASFRRCRARGSGLRATAARRRLSRRTVRKLSGNAKGRFRTRGRNAAATVRGTVWTTADRCDGTVTRVKRGKVAVRDFRRRRTIIVRAGKSYLAPR